MLKQNKALGVDYFDSGFLNEVADVISYPLTKIFRKSLEYGLVYHLIGNRLMFVLFSRRVKRYYLKIIDRSA